MESFAWPLPERDAAALEKARAVWTTGEMPAAGEWLARALPDATYARIEGAAHAPFLSHREAFDRAIDGFLDAR